MVMVDTKVETNKKTEKRKEQRNWYLIDVEGRVLGRLATRIAKILMGKDKPSWQPYLDGGDYVVVVNAKKVKVTGNKEEQKKYYRYSGYPGGLKVESLKHLRARKPQDIIYHAVKGMLPRTRLGAAMIKKLYIYADDKHPHKSQDPQNIKV